MRRGGCVIACLVAGRTLACRHELVDERERRDGRNGQHHNAETKAAASTTDSFLLNKISLYSSPFEGRASSYLP